MSDKNKEIVQPIEQKEISFETIKNIAQDVLKKTKVLERAFNTAVAELALNSKGASVIEILKQEGIFDEDQDPLKNLENIITHIKNHAELVLDSETEDYDIMAGHKQDLENSIEHLKKLETIIVQDQNKGEVKVEQLKNKISDEEKVKLLLIEREKEFSALKLSLEQVKTTEEALWLAERFADLKDKISASGLSKEPSVSSLLASIRESVIGAVNKSGELGGEKIIDFSGVSSFKELFELIDKVGGVKYSNGSLITADDLKITINLVRNRYARLDEITRKGGLREKVSQLIIEEDKRNHPEVEIKSEEKNVDNDIFGMLVTKEQKEKRRKTADNKLNIESLEKNVGFLDVDPRTIFEKISDEELQQLKEMMENSSHIENDIYTKQNELLIHEDKLSKIDKKLSKARKALEIAEYQILDETSKEDEPLNDDQNKKKDTKAGKQLSKAQEKLNDLEKETISLQQESRDKIATLTKELQELNIRLDDTKKDIFELYSKKIKEILKAEKKENMLAEADIDQAAKTIHEFVEQTIDFEINKKMSSFKENKGKIFNAVLKASLIIGGTALLVSQLGGGAIVLSLGVTSSRQMLRKLLHGAESKFSKKDKNKQDDKKFTIKDQILENFLGNKIQLKKQLSGHISNILRSQTNEQAKEKLSTYKEAKQSANSEVLEAGIGELRKELYLRSLTYINNNEDYQYASEEAKQHAAIGLSLTLTQHERVELESINTLERIKKDKPRVFTALEKYNRAMTGVGSGKEKFLSINKNEIQALLLGTAMGIAISEASPFRILAGAAGGATVGYKVGEYLEKRKEAKGLKEISQMIDEAEQSIEDIDFPSNKLEEFRKKALIIQSKLDLGMLNVNPVLKSRAHNFLHNVQKIEIENQKAVDQLVKEMDNRLKSLDTAISKDVERLEKLTKRRRLVALVSGAIIGGTLSFFIGSNKNEDESEKLNVSDVKEKINHEGGYEPDVDKPGIIENLKSRWPFNKNEPITETKVETPEPTVEPEPAVDKPDVIENLKSRWRFGKNEPITETKVETPEHIVEPEPETPEVVAEKVRFENKIDSSEVEGSDSIWKSTKEMVEDNAEKLGYKGDINNEDALDKWAETKTANLVNELNKEQGNNLADLVHDGDKVVVDFENGKPHLSFEASSGMEAGHLADTNPEEFFKDTKFTAGVEHHTEIDSNTGDAYHEIKTEDDVYKVYDWDRDGKADIVMPDNTHQEMTATELKDFLEKKNITLPPEDMDVAEQHIEDTFALQDKVDNFINQPDAIYKEEIYEAAKNTGKLKELFHNIVASKKESNFRDLIKDYAKDHSLSDNKRDIFFTELKHAPNLDSYQGDLKDLENAFDKNIIDSFKELKSGDAHLWRPIKLGDNLYALAQKDHTRNWFTGGLTRSDHYYVDTNGDGVDFLIEHEKDMAEAFKKGFFKVEEDKSVADEYIQKEFTQQVDNDFAKEYIEQKFAEQDKINIEVPIAKMPTSPVVKIESDIMPNLEDIEASPEDIKIALDNLSKGIAGVDKIDVEDIKELSLDSITKLKTGVETILDKMPEQASPEIVRGYKGVLEVINTRAKELKG